MWVLPQDISWRKVLSCKSSPIIWVLPAKRLAGASLYPEALGGRLVPKMLAVSRLPSNARTNRHQSTTHRPASSEQSIVNT